MEMGGEKMNKKVLLTSITIITIALMATPFVFAAKPTNSITAGDILYSASHYLAETPIPLGFDDYGYNYQGHMFSGSYFNAYAGGYGYPPYEGDADSYLAENPTAANEWCWPYRDVKLIMKWNDAWLSNKDRDDDGLLDRHYGFDTYIGSGAWLTNHQYGSYEEAGDEYSWNYFVKIVAAPADAYTDGGIWYTAEGVEIGPSIWGSFAIIQQVENDPGLGLHGLQYISPNSAGFGAYMP